MKRNILLIVFGGTVLFTADKAGLRGGTVPTSLSGIEAGGDLITAIDWHEVATFGDRLNYLINNKSPNNTEKLTILCQNQEMEVNLSLGKRP
jgi:S1-C subfamily serine protease